MCPYGPPHMDGQKQDDQLEHTFSSYVRIRDVALKTCQRRWTIRRSGERGSGISVLAARHDDDDNDIQYLHWVMAFSERSVLTLLGTNCQFLVTFLTNSLCTKSQDHGIAKYWTLFCIYMLLWNVAAFWLPFETTMYTQKPRLTKIRKVIVVQTEFS